MEQVEINLPQIVFEIKLSSEFEKDFKMLSHGGPTSASGAPPPGAWHSSATSGITPQEQFLYNQAAAAAAAAAVAGRYSSSPGSNSNSPCNSPTFIGPNKNFSSSSGSSTNSTSGGQMAPSAGYFGQNSCSGQIQNKFDYPYNFSQSGQNQFSAETHQQFYGASEATSVNYSSTSGPTSPPTLGAKIASANPTPTTAAAAAAPGYMQSGASHHHQHLAAMAGAIHPLHHHHGMGTGSAMDLPVSSHHGQLSAAAAISAQYIAAAAVAAANNPFQNPAAPDYSWMKNNASEYSNFLFSLRDYVINLLYLAGLEPLSLING